MVPKVSRCMVYILCQIFSGKTEDGGNKYQLGILIYLWDNLVSMNSKKLLIKCEGMLL